MSRRNIQGTPEANGIHRGQRPKRSREPPTNEIQRPLRHGTTQQHERLRVTQPEVELGHYRGLRPPADHRVANPPPAETARQSTGAHQRQESKVCATPPTDPPEADSSCQACGDGWRAQTQADEYWAAVPAMHPRASAASLAGEGLGKAEGRAQSDLGRANHRCAPHRLGQNSWCQRRGHRLATAQSAQPCRQSAGTDHGCLVMVSPTAIP